MLEAYKGFSNLYVLKCILFTMLFMAFTEQAVWIFATLKYKVAESKWN